MIILSGLARLGGLDGMKRRRECVYGAELDNHLACWKAG